MAAALLVPALVLTGCGSKKKSSDSTAGSQPTQSSGSGSSPTQASGSSQAAATTAPAANSSGGSSASDAELVALITNFTKAKSYKMTIQDAQGNTQVSYEYVAPDKYHLTVAGVETIAIGKDNYVKQGGTWIKLPASPTSAGSFLNADSLKTQLDSVSKAKATKGATASVNGTNCQIYNVTAADGSTSEVCVANGLPIRIKSASTIILISDYDKVSDIKAPI